jgi:hypothetical protein
MCFKHLKSPVAYEFLNFWDMKQYPLCTSDFQLEYQNQNRVK